jgi:acyl-coenzyme A thioesterase PaaI-like protein
MGGKHFCSLLDAPLILLYKEGADKSRELRTLSDTVCGNFAVHGGSAITFADSAISGGDVGVSPGTSITGVYSIDEGDLASTDDSAQFVASAINAWQEMTAIRDDAMPIVNPEIGGLTFGPGTWRSGTTITAVAGTTITLDGQNDRDSKFLFQAATTLTVGIGCHIVLINEARVENVVWAVGTTVTTGANVNFIGSIMAGTAVTFGANTILEGSILALTAVTLGAENQVNGCIVALTAITFGAKNSVSVDVIDFPWLANPYDDLTIVCLPLRDEKDQADAPPA